MLNNQPFLRTLLGTKCEGKFVPDDCTIHVATEHVQCTGLGWWESWETDWQLTTVSANKRQAKILKECVNQWQADRMILPLSGKHWVTHFKKCEPVNPCCLPIKVSLVKSCSGFPRLTLWVTNHQECAGTGSKILVCKPAVVLRRSVALELSTNLREV